MSPLHIVGLCLTVGLIVALAIYSGAKAKGTENNNGAGVVAGVIMGTLVGGSSTIGTAQLAYQYGLSAWWFTLGGGIGCLILALVYAKPIRKSHNPTLVGILRDEYGEKVGFTASILNTVGTFINIISQLLAASAVVMIFLPGCSTLITVLLSAAFMALYVLFGGTKGAGMVGVLKLILLYVSMVICGLLALAMAGGPVTFWSMVEGFCQETGINYFSPFARGIGIDLGAGLSLVFGVLTTQTYAQGILSARNDKVARRGGVISALLIPPIGVFGILVGLYMRSITDPATFVAKSALTQFVLDNLHPLLGGVVLGTLFIASVGTGAGLALGISTMLCKDVIPKFTHRFDTQPKAAILSKVLIVAVLAVGCCLSTGSLGDIILNFAFMSMGLRGAVVFVPLACALWRKGKIRSSFAMASVIAGPAAVLAGNLLHAPIDSLFIGIAVSAVIMGIGLLAGGKGGKRWMLHSMHT
jgi:SSS family solute:Na+ symporter